MGLAALAVGLSFGALGGYAWHHQSYPGRPLFVQITNLRNVAIPLLKIEHGSDFLQESILLTQIRAGEVRTIALNHEPGRGYNVEAQLADGSELAACVGKTSARWVNRVVITPNGIFASE